MSKKYLCWGKVLLGVMLIMALAIVCMQQLKKENPSEKAIQTYQEFISGERNVNGIDMDYISIPTGEPDKRYATKYFMLDVSGDEIPELHVRTGRDYFIFSYVDDELFILQSYGSNPAQYTLLENGFIIHKQYYGDEEWWECFQLDSAGNEVQKVTFSRVNQNGNGRYDDEDIYKYNYEKCSREEWLERTGMYLYFDSEGAEQIRNEIEWQVYCEMKW